MSIKPLLIAAILITYGLISLAEIHWSMRVVFWLIVALGLVYLYEWLVGLPAVNARMHRTPAQNQV